MNLMHCSPFLDLSNNIRSLAATVQFDVRFYFARTVGENMLKMTEDWFEVIKDEKIGLKYVFKVVDKETENRKNIDD